MIAGGIMLPDRTTARKNAGKTNNPIVPFVLVPFGGILAAGSTGAPICVVFLVNSGSCAFEASDDLSDGRMSRVPRGALGSSTAVGGNSDGTNAGEENPYYSKKRGSSSTSEPVEPVEPPDYVK